jgi:large subunit ribosomal protein L17
MRHLNSGRKLNRTASHRKAMLSNLATSILDKERVTTTLPKAKEVRGVVDKLITYGKTSSLHSIRLAAKVVNDKTVLKKLFDTLAPIYKDRSGGYTRIYHLSNRKGDNAEMAIIELVGIKDGGQKRKMVKESRRAPKSEGGARTKKAAKEAVANEGNDSIKSEVQDSAVQDNSIKS